MRPGGRLRPEDLAQGDDLLDMMAGVDPAFGELFVVGLGLRRQPQELEQELLVAGLLAVLDQIGRVVGMLDVLVAGRNSAHARRRACRPSNSRSRSA